MTEKRTISSKMLLSITALTLIFFTVTGFGCKKTGVPYRTSLSVWGVFDNTNFYDPLFRAYAKDNPFIMNVSYRKLTIDSYKQDLLNALAAGNAPDVFMIHNSWIPEFQDKIIPAPQRVIDIKSYQKNFVDVVAQDSIVGGEIYALPLSVDSLGLYYNKDIFNAAGIVAPPTTWKGFSDIVKKLTRIDESGRIVQSAAAIGTSDNINRSVDVLSVLMMQSGATMEKDGVAAFQNPVTIGGTAREPGKDALSYYTSFARGGAPVYTWNVDQHYSIDSFYEGKTAMMINYSYHYDTISAKNAKLNFEAAPLPQIDGDNLGAQLNYANYWTFVVAKNHTLPQPLSDKSTPVTNEIQSHESWQLLRAMGFPSKDGVQIVSALKGDTRTLPVEFDLGAKYLELSRKPAARRDLIETQKEDPRLSAFVAGNLIARSWHHPNAEAVERVLGEMITRVNEGSVTVEEALKTGATRSTKLMKKIQ